MSLGTIVPLSLLLAPAVSSAISLEARQTIVTSGLPGQWGSLGCFVDTVNPRTLSAASFVNATSMTVESCVNFCNSKSFLFAGLEFGQECYCDNVFLGSATPADDTDCTQACTGNNAESCGGAGRLSVYSNGHSSKLPQRLSPALPGWQFLNCFSDSVSSRILPNVVSTGNATVESCLANCIQRGFPFAGVEFGKECWCGSQLPSMAVSVGDDPGNTVFPPVKTGSFCDMACQGNPSERCGGEARIDIYQLNRNSVQPSVASFGNNLIQGCFRIENVPPSSGEGQPLENVLPVDILSVENCGDVCLASGFLWSAVGAGNLCLCDTEKPQGTQLDLSACSTGAIPCPGNAEESCGTATAAIVYKHENVLGVVAALAPVAPASKVLIALIESINASNVDTVAPQIFAGVTTFLSVLRTAEDGAFGAVASPIFSAITGEFVNPVSPAFESAIGSLENVMRAFGGENVVDALKPNLTSQAISTINTLMTVGVSFTRDFALNLVPSLGLGDESSLENDITPRLLNEYSS